MRCQWSPVLSGDPTSMCTVYQCNKYMRCAHDLAIPACFRRGVLASPHRHVLSTYTGLCITKHTQAQTLTSKKPQHMVAEKPVPGKLCNAPDECCRVSLNTLNAHHKVATVHALHNVKVCVAARGNNIEARPARHEDCASYPSRTHQKRLGTPSASTACLRGCRMTHAQVIGYAATQKVRQPDKTEKA